MKFKEQRGNVFVIEHEFRRWAGYEPLHDVNTGNLVGWAKTNTTEYIRYKCYKKGVTLYQEFWRLKEKGLV